MEITTVFLFNSNENSVSGSASKTGSSAFISGDNFSSSGTLDISQMRGGLENITQNIKELLNKHGCKNGKFIIDV